MINNRIIQALGMALRPEDHREGEFILSRSNITAKELVVLAHSTDQELRDFYFKRGPLPAALPSLTKRIHEQILAWQNLLFKSIDAEDKS